MRASRAIPFAFLCAFVFSSSLASAGPEEDGKDLFARGRELRQKGDCAGAVPMFRKAFKLYPAGLGSIRNAAECEEQLGMWASARRDWLDLKRALLVHKDTKYDGWDADADAGVGRVTPKVPHVTITVSTTDESPLDKIADLLVTLDGEPLDRALLGTVLERDPGKHVVKVTGGKEPAEQTFQLAASDNRAVKLEIEPKATKEPPKGKVGDGKPDGDKPDGDKNGGGGPTKDEPDKGKTTRMMGYVTIGLGGALAGGALVTFIMRRSALSDVDAKCPTHVHCDASVQSAVDRGKTTSLLTNVFGIGALVAVGVGVGLVLSNPAPASGTVAVAPFTDGRSGGLTLWGSF